MDFITVEDLKAALEEGSEESQFVDVRTPDEFRRVHIQGFVNIPLGSPASAWAKLHKKAPLYVLCLSGSRSQEACGALDAMGFKNVRNVQGGLLTWRAKGFSVVA